VAPQSCASSFRSFFEAGVGDGIVFDNLTFEPVTNVPLPAALPLALTALGSLAGASRLRRKKA
jgi:hypothetical protein